MKRLGAFLLLATCLMAAGKVEGEAPSPYEQIRAEASSLFPAKAQAAKQKAENGKPSSFDPMEDKPRIGTSARFTDWIFNTVFVKWLNMGKRQNVMKEMRELLARWKFNSKGFLGANPFISGFLALLVVNFFLLYIERKLTLHTFVYEFIFAAVMIYFLRHYNYLFNLLDSTIIHPMGILVSSSEWEESFSNLFLPAKIMIVNSSSLFPLNLVEAPLKVIMVALMFLVVLPLVETPFIIPNFLIGLVYLVGPFIVTLSALKSFRGLLRSWFMNLLSVDLYMLFMFVLYYISGRLISDYIMGPESDFWKNLFSGHLDLFIYLGAYAAFLLLLNVMAFKTAKSVVSGVMEPFNPAPQPFTIVDAASTTVKAASTIAKGGRL